jgi:putative heme-binding domain-containing protein
MPNVMVHEYHPTVVVRTEDGTTRVGTIVNESPEAVTLATPGSGIVTLPRLEVASIEARNESLMPAQMLAGLSDADLRDLFAYILRR